LSGCHELNAAIVVGTLGCGEVKVGEGELPRPLVRKYPESFAEDGVILNFHFVAVAVNKKCGGKFFFHLGGRFRRRGAAKVARCLILTHHVNFRRQITHLIGKLGVLHRLSSGRGTIIRLITR